MLLAVRVVGGAMQANVAVANAYVADISRPEERTRHFGLMSAMLGLGFILGPATGGTLGLIDIRLPFWIAGVLAIANLCYGYLVLPESHPAPARRRFAWSAANPFRALSHLRTGRIGLLIGVASLTGLAQFVLFSTWVIYADLRFGWSPFQTGASLAVFGLVSMVAQGVLIARCSRRFGVRALVMVGLVSLVLAYVLLGVVPAGWMVYPVVVCNVLGYMVTPLVHGLISLDTDSREQGQVMGAVHSLNSLMAVLAPLLSMPLLVVAQASTGSYRIGAPLYLCALLEAAALVCMVRYGKYARAALVPASSAQAG